ncbi:MAG: hypothetical protein NVSMB17_08050 [Candidatus Dormibacteria bacterium]
MTADHRGHGLAILVLCLAACGQGGAAHGPPQVGASAPAVASLPAATPVPAGKTPAPAGCSASTAPIPSSVSADNATALAFSPDGRLFFAERAGTIRVFQDGKAMLFARVPTVTTEVLGTYSERGLLGLAISPSFATDRFVYAYYSEADRAHQRVVRWTDDCHGHGIDEVTIVAGLPAGGDCCHKGGRIAFGPDGNLYVTLGDTHDEAAAQDRCDPRGKVLRYTPQGRDVPGNACGPVFDYGLRNPFGLAFNPDGQMFITNNGPSGDAGSPRTGYDTVLLTNARTEAGVNFQWPACYGYDHPLKATSCPAGSHSADYSSETSTIIPTGASWVTAGKYAGHFIFCTYARGLARVFLGPHSVEDGPGGCALDIKEAPGGGLFASDAGHITRVAG